MRKRKYEVNMDFFMDWSGDLAYAIGFISADGSIYESTLSVELKPTDLEVLEFLQSRICPSKEIETTKSGSALRFRVNSRELIGLLESKFCLTPRKSKTLIMPDMPAAFVGRYVLGLFDGDGWVYCRRNSIESGIVSASDGYLNRVREMSGGIGRIRKRTSDSKSDLYVWDLGKTDSLKLREIMYKDDGFCLSRKRAIFFSNFFTASEKRWSKEELDYLLQEYRFSERGCCIRIGERLGRSPKAVSLKVQRMKLSPEPIPSSSKVWTPIVINHGLVDADQDFSKTVA